MRNALILVWGSVEHRRLRFSDSLSCSFETRCFGTVVQIKADASFGSLPAHIERALTLDARTQRMTLALTGLLCLHVPHRARITYLHANTHHPSLPSIARPGNQHPAFTMYYRDDWPRKADGNEYGDDELVTLLRSGSNPFKEQWDVQQMTNEVEQHVNTRVVGIQHVTKGANAYVGRASSITLIVEANAQPGNPPPYLRRTRSLVSPCARRCQHARLRWVQSREADE